MPISTGSGLSNPDDDLVTHQQQKDLHHPDKSQPDKAKDATMTSPEERNEDDVRANKGIGEALSGDDRSSETEKALERAVDRSRRE